MGFAFFLLFNGLPVGLYFFFAFPFPFLLFSVALHHSSVFPSLPQPRLHLMHMCVSPNMCNS